MASLKGQVECVKILADRGAEVNIQDKVSSSLYTVDMECSISSVVDDDMCTGTLFRHFGHVMLFLLQVINVLGKMRRSFTTDSCIYNDK